MAVMPLPSEVLMTPCGSEFCINSLFFNREVKDIIRKFRALAHAATPLPSGVLNDALRHERFHLLVAYEKGGIRLQKSVKFFRYHSPATP